MKNLQRLKNNWYTTVGFITLFFALQTSVLTAATITSTTTGGAWSTGSTWVGGNVPLSTDDVVIATTGGNQVTLSAPVTSVSLTINIGGILTPGVNLITIEGDFTNLGTLTSGSGGITFSGTANQLISGFTTTGPVTMLKTGGTATLNGNVNGGALTINGIGGTLHLGTNRNHTFTGTWTRTNGTLDGGSSTLNLTGTFSGSGGTFTPSTGTVNFSGGAQTCPALTFNNLTVSNSGIKTFATTPTVEGILSLEGTATIVVTTGVVTYGPAAALQYSTSASRTVTSEEWTTTFNSLGGILISNPFTISLNENKVLGDGVSLTINSGATLDPTTNNRLITIGGNFTNSGTLTSRAGGMTINGTGAQTIGGFTTTGTVTINKTSGTATFTGNIAGAALTVTNGTLNMGAARTHTFSGIFTLNGGTLDASNNTITISGVTNLNSGTLNANSATINFTGTVTNTAATFNGNTADLRFAGSLIGAFNGDDANIRLNGGTGTNIAGFVTTGNIVFAKTGSNITTFTGDITANDLTIAGVGGATRRLNLGTGLSHTINGTLIRTSGTLEGGTSTIAFTQSGAVFSGTGAGFTANTSTVIFNAASDQTLPAFTFNNLVLASSGIKTFATTPTVSGTLTLEGTATVDVVTGVVTYGAASTLRYNTAIARTASSEEWVSPFAGTGGVIIDNTGEITLNAAKQFGSNTNIPLTINSGATLNTNNFTLTFHGGFINNGTLTAGSSNITFAGTSAASVNIGTFSTSGLVLFSRTAGNVTFTGDITGGAFTLNGAGTLNLGTGLNHTFTGTFTRTNGTLNCNSSTINLSTAGAVFSGVGGTINVNTSTFNYNGSAAQTVAGLVYNNLTLSGDGVKTTSTVTVNGILTMAGTATATTLGAINYGVDATLRYNKTATFATGDEFPASFSGTGGVVIDNTGTITLSVAKTIERSLIVNTGATVDLNGLSHTANGLVLGGVNQTTTGTYGRTGSGAANIDNTYFTGPGLGTIAVTNTTTVWTAGNATTDWADAGNWSLGVPTSSLDVLIPNIATQPVLTSASVARNITISTGATLTTNNFQLTIHGNLAIAGSLLAGSSNIFITGNINQSIAGFSTTGNITMTKTAGIATFTGNVSMGSLILNGTGGTLNLGSALTHSIAGDLTITAGTLNANSANISLVSSGAQTIMGFITTGNLLMNKTGDVATLNGNINAAGLVIDGVGGTLNLGTGFTHTFTGTWTRTDGTLDGGSSTINFSASGAMFSGSGGVFTPNTGTVNFSASATQTCPALVYNNLTVSGTSVKTFATTPTVEGTLSMQGTATITVTTGVVTYGPNAALQYNTANARTVSNEEWVSPFTGIGGIIIANTGAITLNAAKVLDPGVNLTINAGAILTPGANLLTLNGDFIINGTLTSGTGGITLAGTANQTISGFITTGTVTMTKTAGTATFNGNVNTANITINGIGGTLNLGSAVSHTISGNVTLTAGTLDGGSANITLSGTAAQSIAGFVTTGNITMTKTGGTATLTGNMSAAALTLNGLGGTLNLGAALTHNFSGVISRSDGTLNCGSSILNLSVTGTVISGAIGTLTIGTSTFNYNGAGAQTVAPLAYNNLILSGSGAKTTSSVTVNGTLTMDGTATTTAPITYAGDATLIYNNPTAHTTSDNEFPATFNPTGGVVIAGAGVITFNSAKTIGSGLTINTGSKVDLNTFAHGSKGLTLGGVAQLVGVYGGTASAAANIDDVFFVSTSTGTISYTNPTTTWTGAINTDWSLVANWTNGIPTASLQAVIPNVVNQPTLTSNSECSDLTIQTGATLTTAGFQLTMHGDFTNIGTASFGSSNIVIDGIVAQNINGFTTTGNVTMLKTGGTVNITGNLNINNLTINGTGGTLNLGTTITHTLTGNLTISAGTLNVNSSNITLAGTALQTIAPFTTTGNITMTKTGGIATFTGNTSMGSLIINGAGGTLNLGSAFTHTIRGDVVITDGTLNGSSSNIILTGTATQSIGGFTTTGNITSTKTTGTATFTGDMNIATLSVNTAGGILNLGALRTHTITGNLEVSAGTLQGNSATVNLSGNLTTGGTFTPGSININLSGNAAQSIAAFTTTGNLSMLKTGGTATFAGNINMGSLTLNGFGATLDLGLARTHTINRDLIITAGTLVSNNCNVTLAGTANQNIAGFTTTGNVSITKTGGTATFTDNINAAGLSINGAGGTLNLGVGLTHTFTGTVSRINGTLNLGSSTLNLTAASPFSGIGGAFVPNTGTVNFSGAAQTVAALTYTNLTLSGSGTKSTTSVVVNGILSLEGTAIVSDVITYGSAATLRYAKGAAYTTTNNEFPSPFTALGGVVISGTGIITFNSEKIISNTLDIESGATVDLNAIATHSSIGLFLGGVEQTLSGTYGAVGSGAANTSAFYTGTGLITLIDQSTTWNAAALTTDWHNAGNWTNGIPNSAKNALITNIATQPILTNDATCKSLTINSGATLISANFQITIHGDFSNNGTVTLGNSPIIITGIANQNIAAIATTGNVSVTKTGGVATLTGNMSTSGLTINGSGGTLNLGSGLTHTFTGDITRTAGNLVGSSANVILTGTNNQTISGITTTGNISVTKTGGTATLSSSLSANDLIINGTGGTFSFGAAFTHTFTGNITVTAGTLAGGTSAVILTGTANQSIAGFTTTGNISSTKIGGTATLQGNLSAAALTINGLGGTLNMGSALTHTFSGTITLTNGTLDGGSSTINANRTGTTWTGTGTNFIANNSTVVFGGAAQTINTPTTFNNLTIATSGLKTFSGLPTVNGIFQIDGTATTSVAPTYAAAATLRYNNTAARNAGVEWITPFVATGGVIIANTGAITLTTPKVFNNSIPLTINATATLTPESNLITLGGDFVNNGTLTSGAGGITINGTGAQSISPFTTTGTVTIAKSSGTATVSGNLNIGNLVINGSGGTLDLGSAFTHTLNGDLTITAGTLTVGSCNITIAGTNTQSIEGFTTTGNIAITKTAGTATVNGNINANSLTINGAGGTLNLGSGTHTFTGDITLTAGTLNGGSSTINVNSTSASAWAGVGSNFIASTSTVSFGGAAQTIATSTTFNNLNLSAAGDKTMGGNVTVAGELAFGIGTTLILGSNTLTLNGTLSNMTASRSFVANGNSNIVIGGTGALGSNLFFDQSTPGTTNRIIDFTYNRPSQTITLGNALELTGAVTPTAGTLATGGNLRLVSNALGDASIGSGTGSYITGNVIVERFIPSRGRIWRFMSSPVSGSTVEDWRSEIYITGSGSGTTLGTTNSNGFDATLNNSPSIFRYDETISGSQSNGWVAPANTSAPLNPGQGYRVFIRGDRSDIDRLSGSNNTQNAVTVNVINPVNTGDINMNPTFSTPGGPDDGWNLMGNPYPSAISWDAFHDASRTGSSPDFSGTDYSHLDPTIHILNPSIGSGGQYASFNALSNTTVNGLTNGIIPSGSAFWVKAVAASPTMTMKEIYKTSTAAPSMFKSGIQQFSVTIHHDNILEDEAVFKNESAASVNVDAYDIVKLFGTGTQLTSITKNGSHLAANCMPLSPTNDTIPLSVITSTSGNYVFQFKDAEVLADSKPIHLIDYKTGNVVNVKSNPNYTFAIDANDASTKGNERFVLIIGEINVTSTREVLANQTARQVVLFPTQTNGLISLQNMKSLLGNTQVTVMDIRGKEVMQQSIANWDANGTIQLDLGELKAGSYFVKVVSESYSQTLKCIKY